MELKDLGKGFPGGGFAAGKQDHTDSAADETAAESVAFPDEESKKATEKAMNLLLHKDRTEHELVSRLERAEFSSEAIGFAVDYVRRYGYINDLRYATGYIGLHQASMSRRQIQQKLRERGISGEVLSEAFSACASDGEEGTDPEEEALQSVLSKRLRGRSVSELTYEEKQKEMRYLAGKGFPADRIRRVFLDG